LDKEFKLLDKVSNLNEYDTIIISSLIGRNEPCLCGSGRNCRCTMLVVTTFGIFDLLKSYVAWKMVSSLKGNELYRKKLKL